MIIERLKNLFIKKENVVCKTAKQRIEELYESVNIEELCIHAGTDLEKFTDLLCERAWSLREELFDKTGFIMPAVRIIINEELQENEFRILVQNRVVENGFTIPNEDFAPDEIIKSLENACIENIDEVFSASVVQKYLDSVKTNSSRLVTDLLYITDVCGLKIILVDLLKDGQSIKNISLIFEKICEYSHKNAYFRPDPKLIAEFVKQNMPVS